MKFMVDSWVAGVIRSLADDVCRKCLNLLLSFLPLSLLFPLAAHAVYRAFSSLHRLIANLFWPLNCRKFIILSATAQGGFETFFNFFLRWGAGTAETAGTTGTAEATGTIGRGQDRPVFSGHYPSLPPFGPYQTVPVGIADGLPDHRRWCCRPSPISPHTIGGWSRRSRRSRRGGFSASLKRARRRNGSENTDRRNFFTPGRHAQA